MADEPAFSVVLAWETLLAWTCIKVH